MAANNLAMNTVLRSIGYDPQLARHPGYGQDVA